MLKIYNSNKNQEVLSFNKILIYNRCMYHGVLIFDSFPHIFALKIVIFLGDFHDLFQLGNFFDSPRSVKASHSLTHLLAHLNL